MNDYSVDLGVDGRRAVEVLFERARASGVIPEMKEDLFLGALRSSVIETERLLLRPPMQEDAESIFERYASDAEVTRYLGWPRHTSYRTHGRLSRSAWPSGRGGESGP